MAHPETYQAVIFDLDGTLLNTLQDIADSVNAVLKKHNFREHDLEKYKYFVGDGVECLVQRALSQEKLTTDQIDFYISEVKQEYLRRGIVYSHPYKGIPELLDFLVNKKLPIAILTNKIQQLALKAVNTLLPDWQFYAIVGSRSGLPKKPDPTGALLIASQMQIPPASILFVGDTATDMQTATNAGMIPVGATWGFRTVGELKKNQAELLIDSPQQLMDILSN